MNEYSINDVHWMPDSKGYSFKYRNHLGRLEERFFLDHERSSKILNYLKSLAKIDLTAQRVPQEGMIRTSSDCFRVSCCPVIYGEKVAIRRLRLSSDLKEIFCSTIDQATHCVESFSGIFLIIGPTALENPCFITNGLQTC